jgi:peptide/nickel transport system permease protein
MSSPPLVLPRRRTWFDALIRDLGPAAGASLVFLGILIVLSLAAQWVAPYSPSAQDPFIRNASPSGLHWFGTDSLGRDALTRVLYSSQVSLGVAAGATFIGAVGGLTLGVMSGYLGGRIGAVLAWAMDMLMAFPALIVGIMVVAALGPGLVSTIGAIGVALVARFARLARASTISIRKRDYVEAATSVGVRTPRIMLRYIIPNISGPMFGVGVVWFAHAIVTEASLSFLGLGVQPPDASWGTMIKDAMRSVTTAPWVAVPPGLAITLAATAITIAGDRFQALLDPRLRPRA